MSDGEAGATTGPKGRLQLFVTCLVDAIRPEVGWAAVRLLRRLGYGIDVPDGQTCCGQPAYNAGEWGEARVLARRTIEIFERSPDPVVLPSGSCADMIVHGYPELLRDDEALAQRARSLAARTRELSQVLEEGPALASSANGKVTYHPACHLARGLGQRGGPEQLLDAAPGLERVPLPAAEECCGFGGLFSVKLGSLSSAMLKRKLDAIESTGADSVVACDLSCLTQIEGGLRRRGSRVRARHIAEILAGEGDA